MKRTTQEIMADVAAIATRGLIDQAVNEITNGKQGASSFKDEIVDGVTYKCFVGGSIAVAVIDCSTPKSVVIPWNFSLDQEYTVHLVYIRDNTQEDTIIDIPDGRSRIIVEGDGHQLILRINRLAKDLWTSTLPCGLQKGSNLILAAPECCTKTDSSGNIYLTDFMSDNVIGIPADCIDCLAEIDKEVYSGAIKTTTIVFKDGTHYNSDDMVEVYEDMKTVLDRIKSLAN